MRLEYPEQVSVEDLTEIVQESVKQIIKKLGDDYLEMKRQRDEAINCIVPLQMKVISLEEKLSEALAKH